VGAGVDFRADEVLHSSERLDALQLARADQRNPTMAGSGGCIVLMAAAGSVAVQGLTASSNTVGKDDGCLALLGPQLSSLVLVQQRRGQ
jgi:hypothetical protein